MWFGSKVDKSIYLVRRRGCFSNILFIAVAIICSLSVAILDRGFCKNLTETAMASVSLAQMRAIYTRIGLYRRLYIAVRASEHFVTRKSLKSRHLHWRGRLMTLKSFCLRSRRLPFEITDRQSKKYARLMMLPSNWPRKMRNAWHRLAQICHICMICCPRGGFRMERRWERSFFQSR